MKNSYTTLSEAITDLKGAGYTQDLNLCEKGVEDKRLKRMHRAQEFNVVKYYRFEGMSNPDDNVVLYVIETKAGDKGLLVDAYGAYSGNVSKEIIDKLRIIR
ncbi:hypothetical protein KCTC52924_02426 [Arenibacter antarcticus]|uniref:Phosphoribosylpyrophosphate synthetase n=1 Tax=Arenibacter antarcticus TaxID=2040469 RepID=A0ABW5VIE3_9FLAO|nr:phosphoribosylpyrophosphate synthetase [Arenibacter sp. H213]MCM4168734.1 phosphoribosylpyrophosphate synthetase [Arenibacter sp. H213]